MEGAQIMRRHSLTFVALLAVVIAAPAFGQVATNADPTTSQVTAGSSQVTPADVRFIKVEPTAVTVTISSGTRARDVASATPDAMVARLMSFDANHDGRVSRTELPERMLGLFVRADTSKDGALDPDEVRRLAQRPPVIVAPSNLLQPGHYGFGDDFGLDTRLHFDSAIEDLRLASATQDEALGIGRQFIDRVNVQAKADVLAAAEPLLTAEQFADFKAIIDQSPAGTQLPVLSTPNITSRDNIQTVLNAVNEQLRLVRQRGDLAAVVGKYQLGSNEQHTLLDAVARFQSHDVLTADVRSALLEELHDVLTDQEREDLGAALERRPIVKQGELFTRRLQTTQGPQTAPPPSAVQHVSVVAF
jgi:hypothetical protein